MQATSFQSCILTYDILSCILLFMSRLAKEDILNLSISERIQLVEDIWDSIVELPEAITLTDDQKRELDNRLDAYRMNPNEGSPWEQVRQRIQKRA
jgi:putative addiction module component (TIGR02574 family)